MIVVQAYLQHNTMGILKINSASVDTVMCDTQFPFSSSSGTGKYFMDIDLGSATGNVIMEYAAGNIPDRFQIFSEGNLLVDTFQVGGFLTGNPPNANTSLWRGSGTSETFVGKVYETVPKYEWNGSSFIQNGVENSITVQQQDVAPFGQTSGEGQISFIKNSEMSNIVTVVVTSLPANTGWDFTLNCPQ